MESEISIVKPIEFEPVTLARLDCIPTLAHGNEKKYNSNQKISIK
jgi:hypothetical protein